MKDAPVHTNPCVREALNELIYVRCRLTESEACESIQQPGRPFEVFWVTKSVQTYFGLSLLLIDRGYDMGVVTPPPMSDLRFDPCTLLPVNGMDGACYEFSKPFGPDCTVRISVLFHATAKGVRLDPLT